MKGTIDVQIKRKDGSVETRHENNVVFDLPALVLKHHLEMPDWMHVFCGNSMNPSMGSSQIKSFNYFGLSEDEFSLTRPEYRPLALVGVASNATQWYQSIPSKVMSGKSLTLQESWTIQTPMTLKGVAVHRSEPEKLLNVDYQSRFTYIDKVLFCPNIRANTSINVNEYQKADFSMDTFSYSNSYANGFASGYGDTSHCSTGCIPYKLANSAERYAIVDAQDTRIKSVAVNGTQVAGSYKIGIYKYPDDKTLLRSFKFSQFTGFVHAYQNSFFVMAIGDKNYLFEIIRPTSSSSALVSSFVVWQIPDAPLAEDTAIEPVKTDFLSEFWPTSANTSYYTPTVVGNYLFLFGHCFKIGPTLEAEVRHGHSYLWYAANVLRYISLEDSGMIYTVYNESTYNYWKETYSSLGWNLYNYTAANFSTPITLAEGDVLTVSYKIEVS